MQAFRRSRGGRDVLAIPTIPGEGDADAPVDWPVTRELPTPPELPVLPPPRSRRSRRSRLPAAALACGIVLGIAVGVALLARGPGRKEPSATHAAQRRVPHRPTPPAPSSARAAARPQRRKPHPTAAERARAEARRVAARLPVALASAALLRSGGAVWVVGGSVHGTPTDRIWRIDVPSGRVRLAGRFIEPLADAAAVSRAGALYLAGGWTGARQATAVLRWTPPGGAPAVLARLPVAVRGARAAFAGATLYVTGGRPHAAYAVDLGSGRVARATPPRSAVAPPSNLATLAAAFRPSAARKRGSVAIASGR